MNLSLIFLTSFFIGLSGAISPGPLLAITIEQTIKKGYKAGPLIIIGHSILELLMVIFLIIGFGEILKKGIVQNYLNIFGGFFLICFGVLTLISIKNINLSFSKSPQNNYSLIFKGIFVSLSNPYWTIWWVTIGFVYLSFALLYGFFGIFLFFVGHISSDFLWYSFVSYSLYKSKKLMKEAYLKYLSVFLGIFLICFGIFLISKAGTCK
ncbi:MAG: LysE family translocator [Candidatus Omnitrophica bacterium]|nr:LysE family translocator [Candidatus Omnitrophota bacterium]MCM8802550.1 LysE family translocator [Candidatus Omnitrophota bacterium]